jgi:hypothetical protein
MNGARIMTPYVEGLIAKYGAVVLGVGAGTAAKYKLSMGEGRKLTIGEVASDLLLLPMIILIAAYVGAKLGAEPHLQAVMAAFLAVSSDRLIRLLRERFIQRVDQQTRVNPDALGEVRQQTQAGLSEVRAEVDQIKRGE